MPIITLPKDPYPICSPAAHLRFNAQMILYFCVIFQYDTRQMSLVTDLTWLVVFILITLEDDITHMELLGKLFLLLRERIGHFLNGSYFCGY
jgi:hypothetical protein